MIHYSCRLYGTLIPRKQQLIAKKRNRKYFKIPTKEQKFYLSQKKKFTFFKYLPTTSQSARKIISQPIRCFSKPPVSQIIFSLTLQKTVFHFFSFFLVLYNSHENTNRFYCTKSHRTCYKCSSDSRSPPRHKSQLPFLKSML